MVKDKKGTAVIKMALTKEEIGRLLKGMVLRIFC